MATNRRRAPDPLTVVEAGYRWVEDESAWLAGIAEAASPFGVGSGTAVCLVDLEQSPVVGAYSSRATADTFEQSIRTFTSTLTLPIAREMYAPTEFCGNASYRLRRLAKEHGVTIAQLTKGTEVPAWALIAGDPRKRALAVAFPAHEDLEPDEAFPKARVLGLAAAHLSAALRLRALAAPAADLDGVTESVLTPNGKVLDASGDAQGKAARESLVEAVVRRERARGRMRKIDPDDAAEHWSVLVSGQWSIVDFVDRDGKRLLLARRNRVEGPDVAALSSEERDVLWLATHGHSRKYIAYELGLSVAQVGRRLTTAMRKLKVNSRRDLLRRFAGSEAR